MKPPLSFALLALIAAPANFVLGQGSLTPPCAPAPTLKTLSQVEPRAIDVLSGRNVIFRNVAIANSTDYNIVAGNTHWPIINAIGAGDVSAVAGANHPTANFRY